MDLRGSGLPAQVPPALVLPDLDECEVVVPMASTGILTDEALTRRILTDEALTRRLATLLTDSGSRTRVHRDYESELTLDDGHRKLSLASYNLDAAEQYIGNVDGWIVCDDGSTESTALIEFVGFSPVSGTTSRERKILVGFVEQIGRAMQAHRPLVTWATAKPVEVPLDFPLTKRDEQAETAGGPLQTPRPRTAHTTNDLARAIAQSVFETLRDHGAALPARPSS